APRLPRALSVVDADLAGLDVDLHVDVAAVAALDLDLVLDTAVVRVQLPRGHAPRLRLAGEVDRVGVGQRRGPVGGRAPVVIVVGLVLGHLTGGRVDVELVLGAVEDELQLPLPGRAVVIDLDLHQIAAAGLLPADLDRLLGTDRQLRRGQVGVRGQRLVPGSRGGPAAVGVPTAVGGRGAGSLVGGLLGGRVAAAAVGLRGAVALLGGAGA